MTLQTLLKVTDEMKISLLLNQFPIWFFFLSVSGAGILWAPSCSTAQNAHAEYANNSHGPRAAANHCFPKEWGHIPCIPAKSSASHWPHSPPYCRKHIKVTKMEKVVRGCTHNLPLICQGRMLDLVSSETWHNSIKLKLKIEGILEISMFNTCFLGTWNRGQKIFLISHPAMKPTI